MGLAATALENGGLPVWLGDGSPRNLALLISQEADVDALDSTCENCLSCSQSHFWICSNIKIISVYSPPSWFSLILELRF